MEGMRRSTFVPYKPPLTEENLPDQTGKVFLVTGASNGVGKELARILYQHNARVWLAARSESRTQEAIEDIRQSQPDSKGQLMFLKLQLDDLTTIKDTATQFLSQESRLDVCFNNAGVMMPPEGSKTVQGYELQLGTNALGHFLLIHFLTPLILETAKRSPWQSVRIIWVSSMSVDFAPKPAIDFRNMDYHKDEPQRQKYNRSKCGNVLHSAEFARRHEGSGVLSLSLTPGLLKTGLQKHFSKMDMMMVNVMGYPPKFGAYTELFAGLDQSIGPNDRWVTAFGKKEALRADLLDPELGRKYWEWSEEQIKPYI